MVVYNPATPEDAKRIASLLGITAVAEERAERRAHMP